MSQTALATTAATAPARAIDQSETAATPVAAVGTPYPVPPIAKVTIVTPLYNEEGNVVEFHRQLSAAMIDADVPWNVVFVDDGSTDGTWGVVARLAADDPGVTALRHRRNFGKAEALSNGFAAADGDVIITMDGDLQDDPKEIPLFLAQINNGWDLVSGWKTDRQDPRNKTAPSKLFNWTVRKVTGVPLHDFNCGFKAYRKEVTENIRLYGELHRFTPVLANAEGFQVTEVPVEHHPRVWGSSKYGYKRLIKGFLDLLTVFFLTNYRQRPMHLFGLPGLLALALGTLIGLFLSVERLVQHAAIGNRPLLLLAILLVILGAQFFALGLLGEFLAHSSERVRRDPAERLRQWINYTPVANEAD